MLLPYRAICIKVLYIQMFIFFYFIHLNVSSFILKRSWKCENDKVFIYQVFT